MAKKAVIYAGGVAVTTLILLATPIPGIIVGLVFLALVAAPVVGYLLLDPSQRRRLRSASRKRIGS